MCMIRVVCTRFVLSGGRGERGKEMMSMDSYWDGGISFTEVRAFAGLFAVCMSVRYHGGVIAYWAGI